MKNLLLSFSVVMAATFLVSSFCAYTYQNSPSLWGLSERGLQEPVPVDCLDGDLEDTENCKTPYPDEIDNYCDFIHCDNVQDDGMGGHEPVPHGAAIFHQCSENGLKYYDTDDMVFTSIYTEPFFDYTPIPPALQQICTRPAICKELPPIDDTDCYISTWDDDGGRPDSTGDVPELPGNCNEIVDVIIGICRKCEEKKTGYTYEEVEFIAANTVMARDYDQDLCDDLFGGGF